MFVPLFVSGSKRSVWCCRRLVPVPDDRDVFCPKAQASLFLGLHAAEAETRGHCGVLFKLLYRWLIALRHLPDAICWAISVGPLLPSDGGRTARAPS